VCVTPAAQTPAISSLSITSATADSTARTLTIYGSNFASGNVVKYRWLNPAGGTTATPINVLSASQLAVSFNPGSVTDTIYVKICQSASSRACSAEQTISVTVSLPAGYVSQGGLTWMQVTSTGYTWTNANAYCTGTTINGQTGWRMPTTAELSALYASGVMNGQVWGLYWTLYYTWSSTPRGAGGHELVRLSNGSVEWSIDAGGSYATCVR
jgi:hypothetical protein